LFPSVDLFDDSVGVGGPDEGFWILVVLGEEAIDSGLEIDDGMEHTAFQPPFRELGEEALDGIEPGGRGRREVEMEPWMALQPCLDLGVLVGRLDSQIKCNTSVDE